MSTSNPVDRLKQLEAAIRHHRDEKGTVPDCTCWVTHAQKLDAVLYASLGLGGTPEVQVALLEEAIRINRHGKKDVPDCPCWGNAPMIVDAELFGVLDLV